jgi:hypothetical protein
LLKIYEVIGRTCSNKRTLLHLLLATGPHRADGSKRESKGSVAATGRLLRSLNFYDPARLLALLLLGQLGADQDQGKGKGKSEGKASGESDDVKEREEAPPARSSGDRRSRSRARSGSKGKGKGKGSR